MEQSPELMKKVYIQTWGCQMNVADSDRMTSLLAKKNFVPTSLPDEADVIILNTCHIREKARHKVVSRLGELKRLKDASPDLVLAVAGCVAQAESKKLANEVPFLDLIFGPDQIEKVPELVESVWNRNEEMPIPEGFVHHREPVVEARFEKGGYDIPLEEAVPWMQPQRNEVSRYVNIIKGCNNFCTFCVVPYTRGREKSRLSSQILEEVRFLRDRGVKEIVLLGQNVNSYGLDLLPEQPSLEGIHQIDLPFANLLEQVAEVDGIERIRFTTSNPHDLTRQLAQSFKELPKLASHFHLPVQSGSNRILSRMNRQYTREHYLERAKWLREARPDLAFGTDIIVGFPGESESDFQETLSLVEEMRYASIYAFKYSKRAGTPATRFKDVVPDDVASRRLQELLKLQDEITLRQNLAEIGSTREVLILYQNRKEKHSWYGRTSQGRLVKVSSPRNIEGMTIPIEIVDANKTALAGHPAQAL